MLVFLTSLSKAHAFSTGSLLRSSCDGRQRFPEQGKATKCGASRYRSLQTHGDGHQNAGALDLSHVGDATNVMGLEPLEHLPALADDGDGAIVGADKEAVRAFADTRYLVALEELAGFVVGKGDGRNVEEVKRLPLSNPGQPSTSKQRSRGFQYRDGHLGTWTRCLSLAAGDDDGGTRETNEWHLPRSGAALSGANLIGRSPSQ